MFKAALCCCFTSSSADYERFILYLHPQERNYFNALQFKKRIRSYLMGRFVAKKAVALLTGEKNLTNIFIQSGIFSQPIVVASRENIQVSISHCDEFGVALAFPEAHPLGIDIEKINHDKKAVLENQMTPAERKRISSLPLSYEVYLTILWTAKEALSKVLKTGLTTPFEVFEISKTEFRENYIVSYYKNFAQYKVVSFTIGNYVCSLIQPLKSQLHFDILRLKTNFAITGSSNGGEEVKLAGQVFERGTYDRF